MMPPTRKHKTLSLNDKFKILDRLNKGESGKKLALEYGVGTSTISDIKKNQGKIKRFVGNCYSSPGKRKTLKQAEYPQMEKRLYSWFCSQRARHVPISYEILSAKAKQFFTEIYGNDTFTASRGWIRNFRSRHGLRVLKICGEKLSNNEAAVEPFITALRTKMQSLRLCESQVYNADESALFWRMLPEKTMVRAQEKTAPGRKINKERVTFLACTNADGTHKLKLLVIGKSKNPRAFKNAELPVEYKHSKNAWMTFSIFEEWFKTSFIRQVKRHLKSLNLPEKALLLVDNATSHGSVEMTSEDGCFTIMFLPPNCTALIQPLDQNAIKLTKLFYRKSLLAHILSNEDEEVIQCLKNLSLKDAIGLLSNAWLKVSPQVIKNCWKRLLSMQDDSDSEYEAEDLIPLSFLKERITDASKDIATVTNMLDSLGEETFTNNEVVSWIQGDEDLLPLEDPDVDKGGDSDKEEETEPTRAESVKNEEAVKAFNICLKWAEANEVPMQDILVLQRLKETAFLESQKKVKQAKITNYFVALEWDFHVYFLCFVFVFFCECNPYVPF